MRKLNTMHIKHKNIEPHLTSQTHTHLATFDHGRSARGPDSNTFSAVSAKPSDGVFVLRHTSCDTFTRMCTQCVQIKHTTNVPTAPNSRPAFLKAIGIARIPLPSELFSMWPNEPKVLFGFATERCANGSYSSAEEEEAAAASAPFGWWSWCRNLDGFSVSCVLKVQ